MLVVMWLRGLVGRRGGRLAAAALGITFAVALLAALGSFLGASKATMAQRSIQQVAVDWQVEAQPGADPAAVVSALRSDPTVAATLPCRLRRGTGPDRHPRRHHAHHRVRDGAGPAARLPGDVPR